MADYSVHLAKRNNAPFVHCIRPFANGGWGQLDEFGDPVNPFGPQPHARSMDTVRVGDCLYLCRPYFEQEESGAKLSAPKNRGAIVDRMENDAQCGPLFYVAFRVSRQLLGETDEALICRPMRPSYFSVLPRARKKQTRPQDFRTTGKEAEIG